MAEAVEDLGDVDAHGVLRDAELAGDAPIGQPLQETGVDIAQTGRQLVDQLLDAGLRGGALLLGLVGADEHLRGARGHDGLAAAGTQQRRSDVLGALVLGDEAVDALGQGLGEHLVTTEDGEHDNGHPGEALIDRSRGLGSVHIRHVAVQQDDVDGLLPGHEQADGLASAGGGGDDGNGPLRVELFGESGANERVVINDEDSQGTQGVARHKRLRPVTT